MEEGDPNPALPGVCQAQEPWARLLSGGELNWGILRGSAALRTQSQPAVPFGEPGYIDSVRRCGRAPSTPSPRCSHLVLRSNYETGDQDRGEREGLPPLCSDHLARKTK